MSQSGLPTPTEPLGLLEIEQVVVLALAQALRPGLLRPLIAAVLAFHAPRHVDAAEFLDGMVADPVAEDGLPGAGESPEARRDVSAHGPACFWAFSRSQEPTSELHSPHHLA